MISKGNAAHFRLIILFVLLVFFVTIGDSNITAKKKNCGYNLSKIIIIFSCNLEICCDYASNYRIDLKILSLERVEILQKVLPNDAEVGMFLLSSF